MTATIRSSKTTAIRWADVIEYSKTGVKRKILLECVNRKDGLQRPNPSNLANIALIVGMTDSLC